MHALTGNQARHHRAMYCLLSSPVLLQLTIYIQPEGQSISQHGTAVSKKFQATLQITIYPSVL
jgi:hypothetical protein